jgi:Transglutaminase-like superfamily
MLHQVLANKQGLPTPMCILYSTVCAAIGMKHVPYGVSMPDHFVLACKLSDRTGDSGSAVTSTVIIDVYRGGALTQQPQVINFFNYLQLHTFAISCISRLSSAFLLLLLVASVARQQSQ